MLSPINFLVWNIRGASRMDSLRYLNKLCHDHLVRLLDLLELMCDIAQLDVVQHHLSFDNLASFVEGKIWVFGRMK